MRDKDLYSKILGIEEPWRVEEVELDAGRGEVRVVVKHRAGRLACPECGRPCSGYDARPRRWRHLDTCQYRTILVAQVPRVECTEHGVRQVSVAWGEPGSRFTALFEALVIDWLQEERWTAFEPLRTSTLRTARAWAIKTVAMTLWHYRRRAWARKAWLRWYSWAIRSRLEPVKRVARMVKRHLEGILTAVVLGITNARAEGLNAKIQWIKATAHGFRNRDRFRNAIYFHCGGLDLYPATLTR